MRGTRASVVKSSNGGTPGGMMRSNTACSSGGNGDGTGSTRGAGAVIECSFGTDGEILRMAAQRSPSGAAALRNGSAEYNSPMLNGTPVESSGMLEDSTTEQRRDLPIQR